MALSPKSVLTAISERRSEFEQNPTMGLFTAWGKMWETQKKLAHFFNCSPQHLYLRTNVTYVMNDFIMALKLDKNSEILISDLEYGAIVNICNYKAKIDSLTVRTTSFYNPDFNAQLINKKYLLEKFEQSLGSKTKLVVMSHVMTGNGLVLPIEDMAKICRERQIIFAVDGAHGAGATDLNLQNTSIDFYGGNLHKWLMGPKGTGFGYVAPNMREYLEPKFAGWTTEPHSPHSQLFGDGDDWTSRWMICSTHQFADFYAINETLNFWTEHNAEKIMNQQKNIKSVLADEMQKQTGWRNLSDFSDECKGPMMAFELPDQLRKLEFNLVFKLLEEKKLQVSVPIVQNRSVLRLSPHIYNTEEEMQQVAGLLSDLA